LPPATNPPQGGIKPVTPITPITPLIAQQAGPQEEIPPIGQALAIGSEDVEVVECYKCGGLITVTTPQRPVIIACPACGTKGEVTAEDLAPIEADTSITTKATAGVSLDEQKIFKFDGEHGDKPSGPTFGSTLDADLANQDKTAKPKPTDTGGAPAPKPAATPQATKETPKVEQKTPQPQKKD
jgi:DNA-directed RNA polymerase subunit M/transcription elongation factor TFIIS